jgi:hypothetical protein
LPLWLDDREDRSESGLQALIATLRRRDVRLQEGQIGFKLGRQQEGHVQHARALGEALADALFLGIGVRHIGSGGEKSIFSCQLLRYRKRPFPGNWQLETGNFRKGKGLAAQTASPVCQCSLT